MHPATHLKLNILLNLTILILVILSLALPHWITFKDNIYSLTGMDMANLGGWQTYADFKQKC